MNCPVRLTYTTEPVGVGIVLAIGDGEVSRALDEGLAVSPTDGVPSAVEGKEPHPASNVTDARVTNDLRIMNTDINDPGAKPIRLRTRRDPPTRALDPHCRRYRWPSHHDAGRSRPSAIFVPHRQGLAQRSVHHSPGAADVDHQRLLVEQNTSDLAIACDSANGIFRQRHRELHLTSGRPDQPLERLQGRGDLKSDRRSAGHALMEGVRQAHATRAVVMVARRLRQGLEGTPPLGSPHRIEHAPMRRQPSSAVLRCRYRSCANSSCSRL